MNIESLIFEKSEPSSGYSLYRVDMSIIIAHFPVILMFQKTYDSAAIGEPRYRNKDSVVAHAWLLSHGAWTTNPMIGRTQVVMVLAVSFLHCRKQMKPLTSLAAYQG